LCNPLTKAITFTGATKVFYCVLYYGNMYDISHKLTLIFKETNFLPQFELCLEQVENYSNCL
jgi:hypothetical protein